jgi:hypothetical protein
LGVSLEQSLFDTGIYNARHRSFCKGNLFGLVVSTAALFYVFACRRQNYKPPQRWFCLQILGTAPTHPFFNFSFFFFFFLFVLGERRNFKLQTSSSCLNEPEF